MYMPDLHMIAGTLRITAAGKDYPTSLFTWEVEVTERADNTVESRRRYSPRHQPLPKIQKALYRHPNASLDIEVRTLDAEVLIPMLHGRVERSPNVDHYNKLRNRYHSLLLRCIAFGQEKDSYSVPSYDDALSTTKCENLETSIRRRAHFFAGFLVGMNDSRLPKRRMTEQLPDGMKRG